MLFNSYIFIFLFLPFCFLIAKQLRGHLLITWISLASIFFYAFAGHVWFILPMAFTTTLDFFLAKRIYNSSGNRRRNLLLVSLLFNIGLLFYFKYSSFFAANLSFFLDVPESLRIFLSRVVLPAGISFYTFQTVSYIVDVYKNECPPEHDFMKFVAFVTFFPHLVAGPITRHNQLIPQLSNIERQGLKQIDLLPGTTLFILGLSKKLLIADPLAIQVNWLLTSPELNTVDAWLAAIGYTLQIYFDFSGYSEMALGLGRLFNIELPQNFNRPYHARSPSEFWLRWHMSLSSWLRDYVYITLGGNRVGKLRMHFNLIATMLIGGLWHGANWTFIIWGLVHGIALVCFKALRLPRRVAIDRFILMFLVIMGWVFFRSPDLEFATLWYKSLFNSMDQTVSTTPQLCFLLAFSIVITALEPDLVVKTRTLKTLTFSQKLGFGFLAAIAVTCLSRSSVFLYFQF